MQGGLAINNFLFSILTKAFKPLFGTSLSRIPGVLTIFRFFFPLISPKWIYVQGSKINMIPYDPVSLYAMAANIYGPFMTEMFKRIVKKDDVVVDLGAHVGYYSLLASRIVGEEGRVYAFEPDPETYRQLVKNIELNQYSNINAIPKAISNKVGTARLFLTPGRSENTLYQPKGLRRYVEVKTETLDHFFRQSGYDINAIKMDIEGGEMDALVGMERLMRENNNLTMFLEFVPDFIRRAGYTPEEF